MTAKSELSFHPLADLVPPMTDEEFEALKADIKANGLREPIVLYEGKILDGRHRYRACLSTAREKTTILGRFLARDSYHARDFNPDVDGDPAAYVISANIHRRHLSIEDKDRLIAMLVKEQPEKSNRQIAKTTRTSHPHVAKVRAQLEKSGDVETVSTSIDTKGRKQPAKKHRRQARDYRPTRREQLEAQKVEAAFAAGQAEAEQLAIDLVKLNRNLAQRLHAHLGEGMWLKDALARRLENTNQTPVTEALAPNDPGPLPDFLNRAKIAAAKAATP